MLWHLNENENYYDIMVSWNIFSVIFALQMMFSWTVWGVFDGLGSRVHGYVSISNEMDSFWVILEVWGRTVHIPIHFMNWWIHHLLYMSKMEGKSLFSWDLTFSSCKREILSINFTWQLCSFKLSESLVIQWV